MGVHTPMYTVAKLTCWQLPKKKDKQRATPRETLSTKPQKWPPSKSFWLHEIAPHIHRSSTTPATTPTPKEINCNINNKRISVVHLPWKPPLMADNTKNLVDEEHEATPA